ncbi:UPF0758 family protein [hydrothermal vent metagenome]|uniref:UPF0758 family protein n=1 Tax=hydrothermal vent metagenome TaxID=652676 RepID=A0A3B1CXJ3_9ZZZZ
MSSRPYELRETIKKWPEEDRPREKLSARGADFLADSELLAIIIGSGSRKKNALDLARSLLNKFDNLAGIESASMDEIRSVHGIGPGKATSLKAALELGRRFTSASTSVKSYPIRTAEDVYTLYIASMKNRKKEIFSVMLLNAKNRLIKTVTISEGALTGTIVHPREVFNPAIRESANSVVFTHNHPSGDPEPSNEDIALTRRLVNAGNIMGIRVVDHLIIGDNRYYSFADNDML